MTRLKSILGLKCPKCGKGDLFNKPGLFRFTKILDMPESCSNCGQVYELEPGFWIGALWTSYPIIVIIELPFLLLAVLSQTVNLLLVLIGMILALVVFYPLMLRLGRSLWIHIFVKKEKS